MKTETVSKRVLWASLIGSSIEWFDYFLYGTVAALVFNQLFFPLKIRRWAPCSLCFFCALFLYPPFRWHCFSHIGDQMAARKPWCSLWA